jgi:hypothetical protein
LARRGRPADGSCAGGFGGALVGSPPEKIQTCCFFLVIGVCYGFLVAARSGFAIAMSTDRLKAPFGLLRRGHPHGVAATFMEGVMADDREKGMYRLGTHMLFDRSIGNPERDEQRREMARIEDRVGSGYRDKRKANIRYGRRNRRSTRD